MPINWLLNVNKIWNPQPISILYNATRELLSENLVKEGCTYASLSVQVKHLYCMHMKQTRFQAISFMSRIRRFLDSLRHQLEVSLAKNHAISQGKLTVITTCSLRVKGPVLSVQRTPKLLKTFIGIMRAQKHPIGYTALKRQPHRNTLRLVTLTAAQPALEN